MAIARGAYGIFASATGVQSAVDREVADSSSTRPLGNCERLSERGHESVPGRVVLLNDSRSPAAVTRLVVAIILNAIKRSTSGPLAHIGNKVLKRFPALCYADASATILRPAIVSWVRAALNHLHPGCVFSAASEAVRSAAVACRLFCEATATLSFSRAQALEARYCRFSAIAQAEPLSA